MAKISPMMIAPPVALAVFGLIFYVGLQRQNSNVFPAPAVELARLGQEEPFDDNDLRGGGVRLVNYWASWCVPCRVEHPNLMALAEEGVVIYGVDYKDTDLGALRYLKEFGNPYAKVGADMEGKMALDWNVYGVPETFVIDSAGNIVLRFAGPITKRVLKNQIRPAIEAAQ